VFIVHPGGCLCAQQGFKNRSVFCYLKALARSRMENRLRRRDATYISLHSRSEADLRPAARTAIEEPWVRPLVTRANRTSTRGRNLSPRPQ
jgi:hypothetical protein